MCRPRQSPPLGENCAPKESNLPGATLGFAMKIFFLVFNSDFGEKLLCTPPKIVYAPQARYTGDGPTTSTMLTESAEPNKLIVFFVLTLASLPAMPTDIAC